MRVADLSTAVVALALVAAACGGAPDPRAGPSRGATTSGPPASGSPSAGRTVSPGSSGASGSTPPSGTAAVSTGPVSPPTPPPAGGGGGPDLCTGAKSRCLARTDADRWWGGKPLLYDRRAPGWYVVQSRKPGAPASDDVDDLPNYVVAFGGDHFADLRRNRWEELIGRGGVVLRHYLAPPEMAVRPEDEPGRPVRVRGRVAFVVDIPAKRAEDRRRTVMWSVPYGADRVLLYQVADAPSHRTEAQLVALLDGLAES